MMTFAVERLQLSLLRKRKYRPLHILFFVLVFCAIFIRSQGSNQDVDADGIDPITTQTPTQTGEPSTTPSNPNDTPAVSTTLSPSSVVPGVNPSKSESSNEADSNSDTPPTLAGAQTTATNLPFNATALRSGSSSSKSQSISTSQANLGKQDGLSEGAVAGIVLVSILGGVALLVAVIMYFRKLEQSIAKDKREFREKQARRYNMEHNPHTSYIPRNQPQPYEI
ncbi:hypothetical protein PCASD_19553 [Puccinia coronata f. sp. avenae]|uniref:Uncharacterized protein n=1 Tax=Puccinia coronata f. sp. avenae TaxID=200324 RepID=A0A2N5SNE5_9BASI|nr:hypothetical protein PCASD_19553 [Puccinia coronata f. sp. avenae]